MPAPSLESNSAPWAKVVDVVNKLLSEQRTELADAQKSVLSKKARIAASELSIQKLEKSLKVARASLAVYEKYSTRRAKEHQELLDSFSQTPSSWFHPTPSILFIEDDILERIKGCEDEAAKFKRGVETLRHIINTSQEQMMCREYQLADDEMSLRAALILLDCILQKMRQTEAHLRPIKRVPDEIWAEILTIVVIEANKSLASNPKNLSTISTALSLSHVSLTWRRVLLGSPRLWTTLHTSVPPEKYSKERRALLNVLFERAVGFPLTIIHKRNSHSTTKSSWSGELYFNTISQSREGTCHNMFSSDYPIVKDSPRFATEPKALILQALSSDEPTSISATLTQELKEIRSITLINVALNLPQPLASGQLTHLKIEVNLPSLDQGRTPVQRKYKVAPLLSNSIESLHLAHHRSGDITLEGAQIQLPNLHTLSITSNETHLATKLVVPSLQNLTISKAPGALSLFAFSPNTLSTLCQNISSLTLDWLHPNETKKPGSVNIVAIFIKFSSHAPKLKYVTFANGDIDGVGLCEHLEQSVKKKADKKLGSVTIEGCLGVSRGDCERLAVVVKSLKVFRTFHKETYE